MEVRRFLNQIEVPCRHFDSEQELLAETVYGIPELFRDQIRGARLVGNPGCFAVSLILALTISAVAPGVSAVGLKDGKQSRCGPDSQSPRPRHDLGPDPRRVSGHPVTRPF